MQQTADNSGIGCAVRCQALRVWKLSSVSSATPAVLRFIASHQRALDAKPTAFFSVNVVARKPGKDHADTNPYVQTFLRKTAWRPTLVGVFAGKIDYPRYGVFDRQIIRLIMWLTHGPTDPLSSTEFTNWQAVDAFAAKVEGLHH